MTVTIEVLDVITSIASMKISALMAIPIKSQTMKMKYAIPISVDGMREVPGTSIIAE